MTGLEKILAEISGEAQAAREAALAQAQKEAQAILDEAARRTETECERIAEKGSKAARQALERAEAGAELQRRRVLLEERQALILNAMETAGKSFLAMPDEEYFDVLEKIAAGYAWPEVGEVHLCQRDLDRLPADFEERINKVLPEGGKLTLSREPYPIKGGMILVYDGVNENCSLRSMFGVRQEHLRDIAARILFE